VFGVRWISSKCVPKLSTICEVVVNGISVGLGAEEVVVAAVFALPLRSNSCPDIGVNLKLLNPSLGG
jgi:hypothetical protein